MDGSAAGGGGGGDRGSWRGAEGRGRRGEEERSGDARGVERENMGGGLPPPLLELELSHW